MLYFPQNTQTECVLQMCGLPRRLRTVKNRHLEQPKSTYSTTKMADFRWPTSLGSYTGDTLFVLHLHCANSFGRAGKRRKIAHNLITLIKYVFPLSGLRVYLWLLFCIVPSQHMQLYIWFLQSFSKSKPVSQRATFFFVMMQQPFRGGWEGSYF